MDNIFGERFNARTGPAWHQHGDGKKFANRRVTVKEAMTETEMVYRFWLCPHVTKLPNGAELVSSEVDLMREPTHDDPEWFKFATVKPTYALIQNLEMAQTLEPIAEKWPIEACFALDRGKISVVTFSTGAYEIKGDRIERYCVFSNGQTGSMSFSIIMTDIRVVCHAKGTQIIDGDFRGNVEDHPSARGSIRSAGREVRVRGLPFPEFVSANHRYWVRQRRRILSTNERGKREAAQSVGGVAVAVKSVTGTDVAPDWVYAMNLQPISHEIGMPIDMTETPAPAIPVAHVLNSGYTRPWNHALGRLGGKDTSIAKTLWVFEREPRLDSPEWWWLIGYWWGDGNVDRSRGKISKVTLTVAKSQPEIRRRIEHLLRSAGWTGHATLRQGCYQITFGDQTLADFLHDWYLPGSYGKSGAKTPPVWVEQLPLDLQRALVQGYYAADGKVDTTHGCILTSVHLDGLLCLRRILLRLGIPSSIRKGGIPGTTIMGRQVNMRQGYTIRFWRGVEQLGYTTRFKGEFSHPYIEDGWLWSRVESVENVVDDWVPITTATEDYLTAFGRSHNCENTLNAAINGAKNKIAMMHKPGLMADVSMYVDLFDQIQRGQERAQKAFQIMADQQIARDEVKSIIQAAYPAPNPTLLHRLIKQLQNNQGYLSGMAAELMAAKEKDHDQRTVVAALKNVAALSLFDKLCEEYPAIAGTAWAAINAVAELSDNRAGENSNSIVKSTLFGERAGERDHAFQKAWELCGAPAV